MNKRIYEDVLFVMQDDALTAEDYINVYTPDRETKFKKGMFVKIESNESEIWIGQIVTSNSNQCPAISKSTDQTMLVALEDNELKKDVIDGFGISIFFKVKLLKKCYKYSYEGNIYFDFEPIDSRPLFGMKVNRMESNEIVELLKVPEYKIYGDDSNAFGYCQTIDDLPLCITAKEFHTHILVSGTTGSGKSNINAHLIKIAQKIGKPVIIHDAKPDFELIEFVNSESFSSVKSTRKRKKETLYKFKERGLRNVYKIGFNGIHTIYKNSSTFYDAFIYYKPSDFTIDEFAKLFFYAEGDEAQEEEFLLIFKKYYENLETSKIKESFDIKLFLNNVLMAMDKEPLNHDDMVIDQNAELQKDLKQINSSTLKALYQKIIRRLIQYPWLYTSFSQKTNQNNLKDYKKILNKMIDTSLKSKKGKKHEEQLREYYKNSESKFYLDRSKMNVKHLQQKDILSFIKTKIKEDKSPIFVIDYNFKNADVTYSFMVNKLLKDIQSMQDSIDSLDSGIVQIVDEAHRLFNGLSKNFKEELMHSLNKVIKEGRVKKHSLVLSLQNASEVPDTALNNFGTKISLRQQSEKEARISTQGMGEASFKDVMNLSPGQFLIKYPAGEFTFLGFGFMSPFQLRVE